MPFQDFNLFDAHFHIIDQRFPLVPNNGYVPEPFTCQGTKWGQVCCWLLNDFCYLVSHVPTIDWYRIFANTGV